MPLKTRRIYRRFRNPLENFALLSRHLDNSNEGTYTDTYQKAEYGNVRCVFETQQYIFVSFVLNERPYKDLPLFSNTVLFIYVFKKSLCNRLIDDDKRYVAVKHRLYRKCGRIVSVEIEVLKAVESERFVTFCELLTCRACLSAALCRRSRQRSEF